MSRIERHPQYRFSFHLMHEPKCPHCRALLDGATNCTEKGDTTEPRNGAFTVCSYCQKICVFDELLYLRPLNERDAATLAAHPEIARRLAVMQVMLARLNQKTGS